MIPGYKINQESLFLLTKFLVDFNHIQSQHPTTHSLLIITGQSWLIKINYKLVYKYMLALLNNDLY